MTKGEFEAMTKDELVAYADDRDIEVHHHWTKDEIIKEIMKAERAAAKEEAKAEGQSVESEPAAEQQAAQTVDPALAANQELAQKLPDESTRFAATPPKEEDR